MRWVCLRYDAGCVEGRISTQLQDAGVDSEGTLRFVVYLKSHGCCRPGFDNSQLFEQGIIGDEAGLVSSARL